MKKDMVILSSNLRNFRRQKNLTRQQMAAYLGIELHRYGKYEYAHNEPPIAIIIKMADLLCITIDKLIR